VSPATNGDVVRTALLSYLMRIEIFETPKQVDTLTRPTLLLSNKFNWLRKPSEYDCETDTKNDWLNESFCSIAEQVTARVASKTTILNILK